MPRKLGKLTSLSAIITPACVQGETTHAGTTIDLEARFIQSLDKVLEITLQHKAVLGLQYEEQNIVRKRYRDAVVRVTFSHKILVFVL